MSEKQNNEANYCAYCGVILKKKQVYCPNCGKLIVAKPLEKVDTKQKQIIKDVSPAPKKSFIRKCPGCGSVITSMILDQCPICNTLLEPIPESIKTASVKTGFVFTEKKLEPEQRFILNRGSWNLKEGLNVFTNSILVYITVELFLIMLILFQYGSNDSNQISTSEINIFLIIISQIPGILLGIFPIWYITAHRHSFEKLGFRKNTKQLFLSLIIGLSGGIALIVVNTISNIFTNFLFSSFFTNFLNDIGINLYDIQEYMEMESNVIKSAGIWIFILIIELILTAISVEIVFRGVLYNTLIEKFGSDNIYGKLLTIVIVALVYSGIYLLFSFPIGIYFLIPNFLGFILLGILYEINKNIYNSIFASIFYNITLVIIIFYF